MMISGLGARFPAGALHDPLPHSRQGSGRYPGSRLKCIAFPGYLIFQAENQCLATQWRM
jgi:hypothetical protein